ncbi:hypothetical protein RP20_CCG003856 [Aedes albopictus]|nr:hypothetical protein RP20_CCG003856 [Aedes albopictus]
MSIMQKRGALIVLEGCDRAGKTTQCKRIVESLISSGHKAKFMNFPDRTTQCGALINSYLTNKDNFTDEGIHLLFTLNRSLLVFRCGIQLSQGFEHGLVQGAGNRSPEAGSRSSAYVVDGGFGEERYEVPELQKKVMEKFRALKDDSYWKVVDADKTEDALTVELCELVVDSIDSCGDKPLGMLW